MIECLQNEVFPNAVRVQAFGPNVKKFVCFEPDPTKVIDHYVSNIIFGEVTLEDLKGQLMTESLAIKLQLELAIPSLLDITCHFHNEVLFYTEVIPLLSKYDDDNFLSKNVPEFVYGAITTKSPIKKVIILKNLNKKGFRMTEERIFLDEKHIKLALDKLAKFHALSYRCQQEDPEGFKNVVIKIRVGLFRTPEANVEKTLFRDVPNLRGIEPLKSDRNYGKRLGDLYKHCENSVFWMNNEYLATSQPMSVLVHGDVTRSNLLYKYDADNQPKDVIFLDWACIKCCSPVIDLGMILLLNTSLEVKRVNWDDFLRTYRGALSRQLAGHTAAVPSFDDLEQEMRKKGVYGYHMSSLILPLALGTKDKNALESGRDPFGYLLECGGSKATEYLADIVKHMLDRNFIFEY